MLPLAPTTEAINYQIQPCAFTLRRAYENEVDLPHSTATCRPVLEPRENAKIQREGRLRGATKHVSHVDRKKKAWQQERSTVRVTKVRIRERGVAPSGRRQPVELANKNTGGRRLRMNNTTTGVRYTTLHYSYYYYYYYSTREETTKTTGDPGCLMGLSFLWSCHRSQSELQNSNYEARNQQTSRVAFNFVTVPETLLAVFLQRIGVALGLHLVNSEATISQPTLQKILAASKSRRPASRQPTASRGDR